MQRISVPEMQPFEQEGMAAVRRTEVEITTEGWLAAYDDIRTQVQADFAAQLQRELKEQGVAPVFYAMWRTPPEPDYEIPLTAEGDAVADVLLGTSYPSGMLTTTWAAVTDDPSTEGFGGRACTGG